MVVVSRVDHNDNDDISNGYDDGDNHFGSKSLDEYDDDHDGTYHHYDQVSVKGKGAMITYWLVGEEPALRAARHDHKELLSNHV